MELDGRQGHAQGIHLANGQPDQGVLAHDAPKRVMEGRRVQDRVDLLGQDVGRVVADERGVTVDDHHRRVLVDGDGDVVDDGRLFLRRSHAAEEQNAGEGGEGENRGRFQETSL